MEQRFLTQGENFNQDTIDQNIAKFESLYMGTEFKYREYPIVCLGYNSDVEVSQNIQLQRFAHVGDGILNSSIQYLKKVHRLEKLNDLEKYKNNKDLAYLDSTKYLISELNVINYKYMNEYWRDEWQREFDLYRSQGNMIEQENAWKKFKQFGDVIEASLGAKLFDINEWIKQNSGINEYHDVQLAHNRNHDYVLEIILFTIRKILSIQEDLKMSFYERVDINMDEGLENEIFENQKQMIKEFKISFGLEKVDDGFNYLFLNTLSHDIEFNDGPVDMSLFKDSLSKLGNEAMRFGIAYQLYHEHPQDNIKNLSKKRDQMIKEERLLEVFDKKLSRFVKPRKQIENSVKKRVYTTNQRIRYVTSLIGSVFLLALDLNIFLSFIKELFMN